MKTAIITGASGGIGGETAVALARKGYFVVVNFCRNRQKAEETVLKIQKEGGSAMAICADISRYTEVERMVRQTLDMTGGIDVLVNNAGISLKGLVQEMSEEDFDSLFAVNVKGLFCAPRRFCPLCCKNRAVVLLISRRCGE